MAAELSPPAALVRWTGERWHAVEQWRNRSWDHGESSVWEAVAGRGERTILKRFRQPRKFQQERHAYEHWCPIAGDAPGLLGVHDTGGEQALLLSWLPGDTVRRGAHAHPDDEPAYEAAGRWLARWHAIAAVDHDSMSVADAFVARANAWAVRSKGTLTPGEIDGALRLVRDAADEGGTAAARVPCHRDFTGRNWLWSEGKLRVIDFEHARLDWFLVDHERVRSSIPSQRIELMDAFTRGYGRSLTSVEDRQLVAVTALSAMSRVTWAVEHRDAAFEASGRAQLARVLHSA